MRVKLNSITHLIECFTVHLYLGSNIDASGRLVHEVHRRIGLASSIMGRLSNIWRQSKLSLSTKLRLYNAFIVLLLLYGCETWTLLQRRILEIHWYDFVTNDTVVNRTGQDSIISRIRRRRMAVFGHRHIRRLPEQVPAHTALRLAVDTRTDNRQQWRRPRGRP